MFNIAVSQDFSKTPMFTAIHTSILFVNFARHFLMNFFNVSEMGMMIMAWLTLTAGGVIFCAFIGSLIFRLINSKALTLGLETIKSMSDYFASLTSTKSTVIR
jgi:hypothetical protein